MSTEENKTAVLDFFACMDRRDIDAAALHFAEKGINHGMEATRDRIRMVLNDLVTTFDSKTEVLTVVAEGEWVAVRSVNRGKHVGRNLVPINMLTPGTEPTGGNFSIQLIHMFRLANGEITEHWAGRDDLGLHWQLGLIPSPAWYQAPV